MKNLQTPRGEIGNAATHDLRSTRGTDLICFSHLRWDALDADAQSSLSRWAKKGSRVFFVQEPVFDGGMIASLDLSRGKDAIRVAMPHLPLRFTGRARVETAMQGLIDDLFATENIREYALWYFSPNAFLWTDHLKPLATIYNCADELSAADGDASALRDLEAGLIAHADLVFASEVGAYKVKRAQHPQHKGLYALSCGADASSGQARMQMSQLVEQLIDGRHKLTVNTVSSGEVERSHAVGATVAQ